MQSPFWAANWFAASQEIPRISRNPKVHYRTHKRPPPVSILGQPNPVHIPTSHLLEIHPNIIHPSTPRFPQWSFSLRFPHQDPIHTVYTSQISIWFLQPRKNFHLEDVRGNSYFLTLVLQTLNRLRIAGIGKAPIGVFQSCRCYREHSCGSLYGFYPCHRR